MILRNRIRPSLGLARLRARSWCPFSGRPEGLLDPAPKAHCTFRSCLDWALRGIKEASGGSKRRLLSPSLGPCRPHASPDGPASVLGSGLPSLRSPGEKSPSVMGRVPGSVEAECHLVSPTVSPSPHISRQRCQPASQSTIGKGHFPWAPPSCRGLPPHSLPAVPQRGSDWVGFLLVRMAGALLCRAVQC